MRKSIPVTIIDEGGKASHLEKLLRNTDPSALDIPLGDINVIRGTNVDGLIPVCDETRLYIVNGARNRFQEKHERDVNISELIKRQNPHAVVVGVTYENNRKNYDIAFRERRIDSVVQIGSSENIRPEETLDSKAIDSLNRTQLSREGINQLVSSGKFLYPPRVCVIGLGDLGKPLVQFLAGRARSEGTFSKIGIFSARGKEFSETFKRATLVGRGLIETLGSLDEVLERKYDIIIYTHALHKEVYEEFESRDLDGIMRKLSLDSMPIVLPELRKLRKTDSLLVMTTNALEPYVRFCCEYLGMNPSKVTSFNIDILRANEIALEHFIKLYKGKLPFKIEDLNLVVRGSHGGGIIDFSGVPYGLKDFVTILTENPEEVEQLNQDYTNSGLNYVKDSHKVKMIPLEVPFMIAQECAKLAYYSQTPGVTLHTPWQLDGERAYFSGPARFDFRIGTRVFPHGVLNVTDDWSYRILKRELEFQKEICGIFGQAL